MMQSRKEKNQTPVSPQKNSQKILIKSAPVDERPDVSKLVTGNTRHQIFSNSQYIFKVSSTFETLYRYRPDDTNETVEILVLKRVRKGDPRMMKLHGATRKERKGTSKPFLSKQYDIYGLEADGYIRGYMLYVRSGTTSERIYYVPDKFEKKGR